MDGKRIVQLYRICFQRRSTLFQRWRRDRVGKALVLLILKTQVPQRPLTFRHTIKVATLKYLLVIICLFIYECDKERDIFFLTRFMISRERESDFFLPKFVGLNKQQVQVKVQSKYTLNVFINLNIYKKYIKKRQKLLRMSRAEALRRIFQGAIQICLLFICTYLYEIFY